MIRLYDKKGTDFLHNGLGILKDVLSCTCTEVLNGQYDIELEYPIHGFLVEGLVEENIIKAPVGNPSGEDQLFRIKLVTKQLKRIRVYATHIFYDLSDNFLVDVAPTNQNGNGAVNWINQRAVYAHDFTCSSDIQKIASARYVRRNFVDALIGSDNAFINTWGGELHRNNKHYAINTNKGQDRGVQIRYGKNMREITWDIDITGVVTRIYPQGFDGLLLPELYIDSPLIENYIHPKIQKLEFSEIQIDEENGITQDMALEQLRQAVYEQYNQGIDKPAITIQVDFLELSKTAEYKELYQAMEKIYLGDYVEAVVPHLNLNERLKVISTTYDVLAEKYTEFELSNSDRKEGTFITSTNQLIKKLEQIDINVLNTAKQDATSKIVNAMGGYVYKTRNELFIMDNENPNAAQKVWRWNINGLGYSSTGISGPYGIAITSDGQIVADFITTGQMAIERIVGLADTLNSLALDIEGFKFDVQHSGGANLILNSVGFAGFQSWEYEGAVAHISNAELTLNGSQSGGAFVFNGGKIIQKITVKADTEDIPQPQKTYYTFSTIIKKGLQGTCYFKVYNDVENYIIELGENEESNYQEYQLKGLLPKQSFYYVEIYGSENSNATFTDNMCNIGVIKTPYQQAYGEILNTQVNITTNGVIVKSNVYDGSYTVMSPLEFSGYAKVNNEITRVFSLNGDTTEVEKLKAKTQISMNPIKIVSLQSGENEGWAFVPSGGDE